MEEVKKLCLLIRKLWVGVYYVPSSLTLFIRETRCVTFSLKAKYTAMYSLKNQPFALKYTLKYSLIKIN